MLSYQVALIKYVPGTNQYLEIVEKGLAQWQHIG